MANSYNISVAPEVAAVQAVVDAIRATDVPALAAEHVVIDAVVDATRVIVEDIHDTDLPAVDTVVDAIRATDVTDIRADIAAMEAMTDKDRSLLGIGLMKGFSDDFNTVANDAVPDATNWNLVENVGTVTVENDTTGKPGRIKCLSGGATGNDAFATTKDKRVFALKNGVTTLHLKCSVTMDWAGQNGFECIVGLVQNEFNVLNVANILGAGNNCAAIVISNTAVKVYSVDGVDSENSDITAYVSDNTAYKFEVVISATDVKFYIDDTLRATHTVRVPDSVFQIALGTTCINNQESKTYVEKVRVWGE